MKKTILLSSLLTLFCLNLLSQDYYESYRKGWMEKAEQNKPKLIYSEKKPKQIVNIIPNENAYQGWEAQTVSPIDQFFNQPFKNKKEIILDFGEHITGYFSFSVNTISVSADGPLRFKFTFGEVPSELMTPFDSYKEGISRAWLQDEIVTVMHVPSTIIIPRRLAFRYVKIELLASSTYYDFCFTDMVCKAQTSARNTPERLPASTDPMIRKIEEVSLNTLKECMQTVYEDGPKRDQRLWIGDLYLESMGNNYSFKQYDITKRCFYLLAGLSDPNGYLVATVIENPIPRPQDKQFLYEYALLYNATMKDYVIATGDKETALDLWPVMKKQLEIVKNYLLPDGSMDFDKASREWWIFFDWKDGLYKEVAFSGVSIFAFKETYELAKLIGKEDEVSELPALIKKMTKAAHKNFYDKKTGLFVGAKDKQISYASQIWMVLSQVASKAEGKRALEALETSENVCHPGTPYLYHYYIQALVDCGLNEKAKEKLISYWGGMIEKGADTFWEAYDPNNDYISPYNFHPMNSYCHAWSCTPVYFIRKYPEIFQ
ncbi:MAG: glycoside hydrolase [Prevotella sp.]|jgi:hypothetical protein|nr:glycoside hydrolase [Prevotella sp.]